MTGAPVAETDLRDIVRDTVLSSFAATHTGGDAPDRLQMRAFVSEVIREDHPAIGTDATALLAVEIADELAGFGPIQRYLDAPEITEVMVNGPGEIWVEECGVLRKTDSVFESRESLRKLIERTVGPLGLRVDDSFPIADARLPDGSRFHAVLPPVARQGPVLTIRKFAEGMMTLADLLAEGAVTEAAASFLADAVRARANIVVSGGTSSGKTSLLNALSAQISAAERLVTVEDAAELKLGQPHVVSLEARPPNVDGSGGVTVRELVRAALRMRPDRIIVGEVRGGEAIDMLQAMNTGHEGSLTTVHANSAQDLFIRLETMVLLSSSGLALESVRQQISAAIDLVVQLVRCADGARQVHEIVEVAPGDAWPSLAVLFSRIPTATGVTMQDHGADHGRSLVPVAEPSEVVARCERRGQTWGGGR